MTGSKHSAEADRTRAANRTASANDRAAEPAGRTPGEAAELDAEIVRDLEADEAARDVRGGPCPASTKL